MIQRHSLRSLFFEVVKTLVEAIMLVFSYVSVLTELPCYVNPNNCSTCCIIRYLRHTLSVRLFDKYLDDVRDGTCHRASGGWRHRCGRKRRTCYTRKVYHLKEHVNPWDKSKCIGRYRPCTFCVYSNGILWWFNRCDLSPVLYHHHRSNGSVCFRCLDFNTCTLCDHVKTCAERQSWCTTGFFWLV